MSEGMGSALSVSRHDTSSRPESERFSTALALNDEIFILMEYLIKAHNFSSKLQVNAFFMNFIKTMLYGNIDPIPVLCMPLTIKLENRFNAFFLFPFFMFFMF
jgi:hypothetical protein